MDSSKTYHIHTQFSFVEHMENGVSESLEISKKTTIKICTLSIVCFLWCYFMLLGMAMHRRKLFMSVWNIWHHLLVCRFCNILVPSICQYALEKCLSASDASLSSIAALPNMLETVSNKILEHITQQCLVCYDAGVPCAARQVCDEPLSLIFPFQVSLFPNCWLQATKLAGPSWPK